MRRARDARGTFRPRLEEPALTAAAILLILAWAVMALRGLRALSRLAVLRPTPGLDTEPCVTVFVPARNEEQVIGPCLDGILAHGKAVARVVVVNDGSDDGTALRIEEFATKDPRLIRLDAPGPDPGERGKPAALAYAHRRVEPTTEWLLFLDADVILRPRAIDAMLAFARSEGADLVTAHPAQEMESSSEHLVLPTVGALVLSRFPPDRIADENDTLAFANGQIILVRRSAYESVDGHHGVASEILEDVRLAERVKARGLRLRLVSGRELATTRMYQSWAELSEGFSKNLYLLLGSSVPVALLWALILTTFGAVAPIVGLLLGWPLGPLAYVSILAAQVTLRKRGGAPGRFAILAPVAGVLVAGLVLKSTWMYLGGRTVRWKGRDYAP